MGTYPSKHKPNTPVEAPSADERWRPLAPRPYAIPPLSLSLRPTFIVRKGPCRPFPHPSPSPRHRMPDSGPLRPFESLASSLAPLSPLELLVQRPPRCSDGDRPYLTAAATAALNRVGRVEGEPTRASEAGT